MKKDIDDHLFKCLQQTMSYEHQYPPLNVVFKNNGNNVNKI